MKKGKFKGTGEDTGRSLIKQAFKVDDQIDI